MIGAENQQSVSLTRSVPRHLPLMFGIGLLLITLVSPSCSQNEIAPAFSTDGHTVYHIRTGAGENGERVIISAAYDGTILCHRLNGSLLWTNKTGKGFPFDLSVADIDQDGQDEVFAAASDGNLYAFDHDGSSLWTFEGTPPLFQVCTATLEDGSTIILTGGVEQTLYSLSSKGDLLKTLQTDACIRHARAGDLLGEKRDYVAVATASRGLNGDLALLLIDPSDMSVLWKKENLGTHAHNSGKRFFSMEILDLDADDREDILLSNSWGEHGRIFAFNHLAEELFSTTDERIPNVPYRMNLLRHVSLPEDEFVIGHFGNVLILYNLDGSCRDVLTGQYSFADGTFDAATKTYYMGSSVSGGDGIYALRLDQPDWKERYQLLGPVGRLANIENNLSALQEQIARFEAPAYQPEAAHIDVLGKKPSGRDYQHLRFISGRTLSQKYDRQNELWNRAIDRRRRYDLTADEIVAVAREMELRGEDFVIWAGHGHAVHFPLSTFQRIFEAAPKHLFGFEFAEMEGVDPEMQEVVRKILLPVAELCQRYGKRIILRSKNIYWNGTCYLPFLREVVLNPDCSDVFIPALEETNCRTQELSLAGRVGLWQTGIFDRWACRMVTDNANFDRMWEWGGQQVPVHHLRHLVSRASMGADFFFNSVHQGPFTEKVYDRITPFYDMVEKGIVYIPKREDLLSISSVALSMRSPPSSAYLRHGINGHHYRYPEDEHPEFVFDRLDCYWAGAPLAEHDISHYGMQLHRRMCNYLPFLGYGLIPIVPTTSSRPGFSFQSFETDGQFFYDDTGSRRTASDYRTVLESALSAAAEQLPIRVTGGAHWTVTRLDESHVRVTMIDPGYLDPANRQGRILLQHLKPIGATDILSGETLSIENNRIALEIPAGTLRIVDIEHEY